MAEVLVGPIIQALVENLLKLSQERIGMVRHFKDDLENIHRTFSMVNDVLHDAEKKQVNDDSVKRWLRELEDLAFDADNVIDEFNYHLLSKKVKGQVQSFLSCLNNVIDEFNYRRKLGPRIKDINEKLKSINQRASDFGLHTRMASTQARVSGSDASRSTETDSFTVNPFFLGRENDVSRIVEKLIPTTPSPHEQVLSVLPIVGMGGLGKTSLAKKVFGDEKIISHFGDYRVWVYVSENFDVRNIFKNILTSLTEEKFELDTNEALLKNLQKHLKTKRYMLVLDDVWNEDKDMWDEFVNSMMGISSATGSCMIVTSRSELVASIVTTHLVHKLESLSEDNCWSIIKAKAFNRLRDISLEFEEVGKNIAKMCQGLPLAAKVVGGMLFNKSKDEWLEIEKNWLSDLGDDKNPISKILKLSYDNLPSPSLKKCFAYCSIFPKGYQIEKQKLIELWTAEGFFNIGHGRSNNSMETIGSEIFDLLLCNSLLQVVDSDDYHNVTHCNMHDLVHDAASPILCENIYLKSRYIGYKGKITIPEGQERYVRTLFFNGKVSDSMFSNYESLHSLTLMGEDIDKLPTSIEKLKHLRYLDISETRIRYLPESIGKLYLLQTLRAQKEEMHGYRVLEKGMHGYLEKLPDSLSCLISLRHIHVPYKVSLPPKIGKLTSLQTLSYFHVGSEKGCGISELENLKDLKRRLEIRNLEKVCDRNEAMCADLHGKKGIYELKLVWDESREGYEENDESVLEGLQPHTNLKRLEICGFKGKSLSLLEALNNVMEIRLRNCSECEELPMLGHLLHLKSLYLIGLTNVKYIGSSLYGNTDNCRRQTIVFVFPVLQRLELCDMPNLKEWDDVVLFPTLKYLKIRSCEQLTRVPSDFPCLEELGIYDMGSNLALENICGIKLTSLRRLTISNIEGLECLPDWLFSNNHNLTKLEIKYCQKMTHLVPHLGGGGPSSLLREMRIWDCSSLRELPDDLNSLNKLETLEIYGCPNLKSIPYPISSGGGQRHGFTSLRLLAFVKCKGLINLPIEMLESCSQSLEMLTLGELGSINNFSMVIGFLHKMTRLRYLAIMEFPKFSTKNIIGSLQHLEMGPLSSDSSLNNVSFNETVSAMLLQCCISLRRLTLYGMEDWECLPHQLQHLTSLERLSLHNFGMEALPEWFGNLESLKELYLSDCKKLRYMPSKQAMQRLTNLEIYKCPLLLKENRSNNDDERPRIVDSEWPKISHIPTVYLDHHLISSDRRGRD